MLKKLALVAGSVLFAANLMAAQPAKAPHVLLETSFGKIEIELDPVKAPISSKNFLDYVDSGFYTNTIFHRVIPGFMVQGGGFTAQMVQKETRDPIKNEASNGLHNVRGTLSMARTLSLATIGKALGDRLFPKPAQADLRRKMAERWAKNDKRAYLASFDAIVGWGVQERLSRITCPTLVISADHDYTPVAQKENYVKLLPDARLVVIEDSRHATPLDQPEVFNTTLLDFLKTVETTTQDH